MSIENNLQRIADALEAIAGRGVAARSNSSASEVLTTNLVVEPAPVVTPVVEPVQVIETPVVTTPVIATAPAVPTVVVPFTDKQGFVQYVMERYKTLGPVAGAEIQNVLIKSGFANINDVPVEKFPEVFAGIEALTPKVG